MKRFTTMLLFLATAAFLVASYVQARGYGMRPSPMTFSDMDTNNDRIITEKEFSAAQANRVTKMANEGRRMKNIAKRPTFKDFDKNSDGKINTDEFVQWQDEMYKKMKEK